MKTARQLLAEKPLQHPVSIPAGATVFQALQVLAEWSVGAALVMNSDRLVGVFSERDYARRVVLLGRSTATTKVDEVMTAKVLCVRADTHVSECLALITEKRIRHLPVMEGERIVGMLDESDVLLHVYGDETRFTDPVSAAMVSRAEIS